MPSSMDTAESPLRRASVSASISPVAGRFAAIWYRRTAVSVVKPKVPVISWSKKPRALSRSWMARMSSP